MDEEAPVVRLKTKTKLLNVIKTIRNANSSFIVPWYFSSVDAFYNVGYFLTSTGDGLIETNRDWQWRCKELLEINTSKK